MERDRWLETIQHNGDDFSDAVLKATLLGLFKKNLMLVFWRNH